MLSSLIFIVNSVLFLFLRLSLNNLIIFSFSSELMEVFVGFSVKHSNSLLYGLAKKTNSDKFSKFFKIVIILLKSVILLYEIFNDDKLYFISSFAVYIIFDILLWDISKVNKFGNISNILFRSILFNLFLHIYKDSQFLVIFNIEVFSKEEALILFNNSSNSSFVISKLNKFIVFNLAHSISISSLFISTFFSSSFSLFFSTLGFLLDKFSKYL